MRVVIDNIRLFERLGLLLARRAGQTATVPRLMGGAPDQKDLPGETPMFRDGWLFDENVNSRLRN